MEEAASARAQGLAGLVGIAVEPWTYEVGSEKIREYASAVGEQAPIYFDREAARAAGFRDIVAPPMFAVVFCRWMAPVVADERLGIDYARMLHGGQEFSWGKPVCAGDVISTSAVLADAYAKRNLTFYAIDSSSTNERGDEVVKGRWTMIVRGK